MEHLLGTVSRNGFVSWAGCRYGVPWLWAGSQVVVKDRGNHVEIWTVTGERCLCQHPRSLIPSAVMRIPNQYDGLPQNGPARALEPVARLLPAPEVEVRPLSAYKALAGDEGHMITLGQAHQSLEALGLAQGAAVRESRLEAAATQR